MTDESLLEWVRGWLKDDTAEDPTFRERFLTALGVELRLRRAERRAALDLYGDHDGDCAVANMGAPNDARCTCGYDDAVVDHSPHLRPSK